MDKRNSHTPIFNSKSMSLADQIIESKKSLINKDNLVFEEIKKQLEDKFFDALNERQN